MRRLVRRALLAVPLVGSRCRAWAARRATVAPGLLGVPGLGDWLAAGAARSLTLAEVRRLADEAVFSRSARRSSNGQMLRSMLMGVHASAGAFEALDDAARNASASLRRAVAIRLVDSGRSPAAWRMVSGGDPSRDMPRRSARSSESGVVRLPVRVAVQMIRACDDGATLEQIVHAPPVRRRQPVVRAEGMLALARVTRGPEALRWAQAAEAEHPSGWSAFRIAECLQRDDDGADREVRRHAEVRDWLELAVARSALRPARLALAHLDAVQGDEPAALDHLNVVVSDPALTAWELGGVWEVLTRLARHEQAEQVAERAVAFPGLPRAAQPVHVARRSISRWLRGDREEAEGWMAPLFARDDAHAVRAAAQYLSATDRPDEAYLTLARLTPLVRGRSAMEELVVALRRCGFDRLAEQAEDRANDLLRAQADHR